MKRRWRWIAAIVLALLASVWLSKRHQHALRHAETVRLRRESPPEPQPGRSSPPILSPAQPPAPERPSSWRDWIGRWLFDERPTSGKVVDGAGRPIAGAAVGVAAMDYPFFAFAERDPRAANTLSAADGSFRIGDVQGDGRQIVWALASGFAPGESNAMPGERGVVIVLKAQSNLRGQIVDSRGAVTAFRLRVLPSKLSDQEMVGRLSLARRPPLTENPNGEFEVDGLSAGAYDVLVETDDKRAGKLAEVSVGEGETRSGLRVVVAEGRRLTGSVVDYDSGNAISSATAVILELGRMSETRTPVRADGRLEMAGLPPGPFQLAISDRGYYSDLRWIVPPEDRTDIDVGVIRMMRQLARPTGRRGMPGIDPYNVNGHNLVLNCVPDSSAARAGVFIGDEIKVIDDRDLSGVGSLAVLLLLNGPVHSAVDVSLQSSDGSHVRTVRLEREAPGD